MAAAIAYRTVFAIAPILVIAVSVAGLFLGSSAQAQEELISGIESIAGPEIASTMEDVLANAVSSANTAAIIGGVLLLWTASSLFIELEMDLNDIFEVPTDRASGIIGMARKRGLGFLWVLGLGLLMIAIWIVNAAWGLIAALLPDELDTLDSLVRGLAPVVSALLLPLVFGLIFQTLTAKHLPWKAVWVGGGFTGLAFLLAAYLIGVYFDLFGPTTALGFAGSVVIILFMAYMLSTVFLIGAEMTRAYADRLQPAT